MVRCWSREEALIICNAEVYNPATGTWTATSPGLSSCGSHTATLLTNGKVLVAGGNNSSAATLYDPVSGTWSGTGSMVTGRQAHTATLLVSGKVLVAGGSHLPDNTDAFNNAELYDPATGSWTATGSLLTSRATHTATLLPDGKVLVAGGFNAPGLTLETAELYDPNSETWTATGSVAAFEPGNMGTARRFHTATLLPNGKVLVAGGEAVDRGRVLAGAARSCMIRTLAH